MADEKGEPFKVGDLVKCVRNSKEDLQIGTEYTVEQISGISVAIKEHPSFWRSMGDFRLSGFEPSPLDEARVLIEKGEHQAQTTWLLEWVAAPRPPAHPNPMTGRQTFATFEKAIAFMTKQASDAKFVSLKQETVRVFDVSDKALTAISEWLTANPKGD